MEIQTGTDVSKPCGFSLTFVKCFPCVKLSTEYQRDEMGGERQVPCPQEDYRQEEQFVSSGKELGYYTTDYLFLLPYDQETSRD